MPRRVSSARDVRRIEFGDWQTPLALARRVLDQVKVRTPDFASVLEPTCGEGTFLQAAKEAFPKTEAIGFDISPAHVASARGRLSLAGLNAEVQVGDFFGLPWEKIVAGMREPILVVGNPPWVTNSALGALGAANLPAKTNFKGHSGLAALTGKSNFDVSEWMILRLLEALRGRRFQLSMLCKASVARRVMEYAASQGLRLAGESRAVDARTFFAAAVHAVLLSTSSRRGPSSGARLPARIGHCDLRWAVHTSLDSRRAARFMGIIAGAACSDVGARRATAHLESRSAAPWRSGLKHDCAKVMELELQGERLVNRLGEAVPLEGEYLFPLFKGADVFRGRQSTQRRVIVPQRKLGDDTSQLAERAPATWRYLQSHRERFEARRSSIYRGQPPFAVFGVGDYSFAPYKVAICGLYKRLVFTPLGPLDGRPPIVDDTSYFLVCRTWDEAARLATALNGRAAREFFEARVFWDAKRPITKALLGSLCLDALLRYHPA